MGGRILFAKAARTRPLWESSWRLRHLPHRRLRLREIEAHVHLAVHRRSDGEVLVRLLPLSRAPEELAEAEVAVGDERAHAELAGEGQGLTVKGFRILGAACQGDVTGEAEGMALACSRPQPAGERQCLSG